MPWTALPSLECYSIPLLQNELEMNYPYNLISCKSRNTKRQHKLWLSAPYICKRLINAFNNYRLIYYCNTFIIILFSIALNTQKANASEDFFDDIYLGQTLSEVKERHQIIGPTSVGGGLIAYVLKDRTFGNSYGRLILHFKSHLLFKYIFNAGVGIIPLINETVALYKSNMRLSEILYDGATRPNRDIDNTKLVLSIIRAVFDIMLTHEFNNRNVVLIFNDANQLKNSHCSNNTLSHIDNDCNSISALIVIQKRYISLWFLYNNNIDTELSKISNPAYLYNIDTSKIIND